MTLRHHYFERITEIDRKILIMGTHVGDALQGAVTALTTLDTHLASAIIQGDERVNQLELTIQDDLTILIATEQPVARDLRHIITSLKVITQLERMGDHAVHIAKETLRLGSSTLNQNHLDMLSKMSEIGVSMLRRALFAFSDVDSSAAVEIARSDDSVDALRDRIYRELLTYIMQDSQNMSHITSLMFVNRWLERFADHVTNICEWVVYDATGDHIELNV